MKYGLLLAATCAVALVLACNNGDGVDITPGATVSPGAGDESPTPTAAADVCQPNPDPASADVATVDSPQTGDSVTSPVTVSGQFAAFEAQFNITIFDAAGGKIADVPARSGEGQVLSSFSEDVAFSVTEETPACVWVYDLSERDGTPIDVVQIPVLLQPGGQPTVCQPNPDPVTADDQVIDEPGADDTVTSPVTISGQVRAFEGTYQVGIFDADGNPIVETFGTAGPGEAGQLAPFSIDVPFAVDEPTPACIWVYEASARDGSPIHVGQIPVTLSP
ncbi:MAG: Gmad2 immunoglobulin-like domain-containing protein [Dehalococcoidia bacterium]|nr:Gmad2 immunoglobulin-like domain-containing protein [Dehalococcoidia bacterium]